MTDATTRAAELLKSHRESIDRLALPPSDPVREEAQIARLTDLAKQADLDPDFAKKFLAFIIQEVIKHHEQHQS
jgi:chorismate mutase